ncbi:multicopper oxidase [Streptomyces brevispora]|uniref:Multicopper oxidase n=1 Tax=Streptomyces brevispora TaxID=887462 RepID=A0A561URV1_9ACTN|nr:multicopper oxidase domain-containing protein [Streptomyces brevispora]TWG02086.1 multicopper oxidase [Streptomyces brevispora]
MTETAEHTEKLSGEHEDIGARVGGLVPYTDALTVPPVLRPRSGIVLTETEIALTPTWMRLHAQLPPTLMWGYNGTVPGPTIEVRRGQRIRIAWTNRIPRGSEYPVTPGWKDVFLVPQGQLVKVLGRLDGRTGGSCTTAICWSTRTWA